MGVLCWAPDSFWSATVYDVERAIDGWQRANCVEQPGSLSDAEKARLQALMADEPVIH